MFVIQPVPVSTDLIVYFDIIMKYNEISRQLKSFSKVGIEKLMEYGPELLPEAMKVVYYYGKLFQSQGLPMDGHGLHSYFPFFYMLCCFVLF